MAETKITKDTIKYCMTDLTNIIAEKNNVTKKSVADTLSTLTDVLLDLSKQVTTDVNVEVKFCRGIILDYFYSDAIRSGLKGLDSKEGIVSTIGLTRRFKNKVGENWVPEQ